MVRRYQWIAACVLLAACSLTTAPPTRTPTPADVVPPAHTALPGANTLLYSDTGPFANQTALLDGVCFEYLAARAPFTWIWNSREEMDAFFEDVDRSELCPAPAARTAFDFAELLLVGAVQTASGCDAAHVVSLEPGVQPPDLVLEVRLVIQAGCSYELVEPLLIAVPRPATEAILDIRLSAGP